MQYIDSVYGSTSFTDPMILELMQSDAMQRLRTVLQHGITAVLGITRPITRFEHSVGAMILVQRTGGHPFSEFVKGPFGRSKDGDSPVFGDGLI
jgi:HD superfamily phosphohydrolase